MIEGLGLAIERGGRKNQIDWKRKIYHYCFTAVSLPLFALTSRLICSCSFSITIALFVLYYCSFLSITALPDVLITTTHLHPLHRPLSVLCVHATCLRFLDPVHCFEQDSIW